MNECYDEMFSSGKHQSIQIARLINDTPTQPSQGGVRHYFHTLDSYQCNLGFTVNRSHCVFPKLFPDCSLGLNVLAPIGNQSLTDCAKALGVIRKKFPLQLFHNLSHPATKPTKLNSTK